MPYIVGWRGRKISPKHAENVDSGVFEVMSVPPILAVYPDKNWYKACSLFSLATGGKTPFVSQVKKITLDGWGPTAGTWVFGRYDKGKAALQFGVKEESLKLIYLEFG